MVSVHSDSIQTCNDSMGFITTNYIGGGLLTERYGSKWVFGLAVFGSSALGFVLPVMASWGSGALLAVRIVQGILQGGQLDCKPEF